MPSSRKSPHSETCLDFLDALYQRRSVRDYAHQPVDKETIRFLLNAAVQAPNAMRYEPWSFAIVQDKDLLNRLSESVKEEAQNEARNTPGGKRVTGPLSDPDFNVFYNAGTLIVICGKTQSPFVEADCWLAAENLMLAARSVGLGSCVIGFAVAALNTPQWRTELNIPGDTRAIAPIILGRPVKETPAVPRKEPEILAWR